jgi:hypothetical protein
MSNSTPEAAQGKSEKEKGKSGVDKAYRAAGAHRPS